MALRRDSTLKLTHRASLNCGVNLISSEYSRLSSGSNSDTSDLTFNATAGIKLLLTNALALTAQYSYTNGPTAAITTRCLLQPQRVLLRRELQLLSLD